MSATSAVLIVDDSADDIYFTGRLLQLSGFIPPFHTASCCDDAMHLLSSTDGAAIRLAFLDLKMPGMGGFEMLHWVRVQPALAHLRVIMLSTSTRPEDASRARALGADAYLVKHPSPSHLRAVLSNIDLGLCPGSGGPGSEAHRVHESTSGR